MKRKRRSASYMILMATLALALMGTMSCGKKSDNSDETGAFVPTKIIPIQALLPLMQNAPVNIEDVNILLHELTAPDNVPNTISLDCFKWRIYWAMVCLGAGTADLQYCSQSPLSYEVVFNGCMLDKQTGIASGTLSLTTDSSSVNILNIALTNFVAVYNGYQVPLPSTLQNYNVFTMKTGNLIGYMITNTQELTLLGEDDVGVPCMAVVTYDPTGRTWTSDQGCGLTAGPVSY